MALYRSALVLKESFPGLSIEIHIIIYRHLQLIKAIKNNILFFMCHWCAPFFIYSIPHVILYMLL
nr:MAG TPA: hypothetical protein [Bacteriophage sp.]